MGDFVFLVKPRPSVRVRMGVAVRMFFGVKGLVVDRVFEVVKLGIGHSFMLVWTLRCG